jgi:hypothetical protein
VCESAQLRTMLAGQNVDQFGEEQEFITFYRTTVAPCVLRGRPRIQPLDTHGQPIAVHRSNLPGLFRTNAVRLTVPRYSADLAEDQVVAVDLAARGENIFIGRCHPDRSLIYFRVTLPHGGVLTVQPESGYDPMDLCKGAFRSSVFERPGSA